MGIIVGTISRAFNSSFVGSPGSQIFKVHIPFKKMFDIKSGQS